MTYFPDWRHDTGKLNETDRSFIHGYRCAIDDLVDFFYNANDYDDTPKLSKEEIDVFVEAFRDFAEMQEIYTCVSLFDNADYLGDDVELVDANLPMYSGTKGAENHE